MHPPSGTSGIAYGLQGRPCLQISGVVLLTDFKEGLGVSSNMECGPGLVQQTILVVNNARSLDELMDGIRFEVCYQLNLSMNYQVCSSTS